MNNLAPLTTPAVVPTEFLDSSTEFLSEFYADWRVRKFMATFDCTEQQARACVDAATHLIPRYEFLISSTTVTPNQDENCGPDEITVTRRFASPAALAEYLLLGGVKADAPKAEYASLSVEVYTGPAQHEAEEVIALKATRLDDCTPSRVQSGARIASKLLGHLLERIARTDAAIAGVAFNDWGAVWVDGQRISRNGVTR
jgi:hypothetical protein